MSRSDPNRPRKPLDPASLERLALRYVERYATTRAKLAAYMRRKIAERGWDGEESPAIDPLVSRFAELGYVDDRGFAAARAATLTRRGYGERRVSVALKVAGISEEDAEPVRQDTRLAAHEAALAYARRKRIGLFAMDVGTDVPDRDKQRRILAAMLRAGHPFEIARKIVEAGPGEELEFGER